VTSAVHFEYHAETTVGGQWRPDRAGKSSELSVILTQGQFKRVWDIAHANDASIAWVLRQAVDRYLKAQRI
jgi:hypothetical protein